MCTVSWCGLSVYDQMGVSPSCFFKRHTVVYDHMFCLQIVNESFAHVSVLFKMSTFVSDAICYNVKIFQVIVFLGNYLYAVCVFKRLNVQKALA